MPLDIIVGERFRKDLGDIDELARSIEEVGLLQPIVVDTAGNLIAGYRRLMAWRQLGRSEDIIPRFPVNLHDIIKGEYTENTVRKDFTPSEAVAIKRAIEPGIKAEAKERQGDRTDLQPSAKLAEGSPKAKNNTVAREQVAQFTNMGHTTLSKAQHVVEAAEEAPEKFGPVQDEMDRTGNVHSAYLQVIAPEIPVSSEDAATLVFIAPTTITQAFVKQCAVELAEHPNAHVYLWVNNKNLAIAILTMGAWGVLYQSCLTWCMRGMFNSKQSKDFTDDVRFALLGTQGDVPDIQPAGQTWHFDDKEEFRGNKIPISFYDVVEKQSPEIIGRGT